MGNDRRPCEGMNSSPGNPGTFQRSLKPDNQHNATGLDSAGSTDLRKRGLFFQHDVHNPVPDDIKTVDDVDTNREWDPCIEVIDTYPYRIRVNIRIRGIFYIGW